MTTNSFKRGVLALALLCLPGSALATDTTDLDTNGDGMISVMEVQAVYPDVTAAQFSAMDLNADGGLDEGEVRAAQDAGMMPAQTKG